MSNIYYPAVGFLIALLPDEKEKFLTSVEKSGRLLSNYECYQYFVKEWNLPPMTEEDDAELSGARIIAAVSERVARRFAFSLDPAVTTLPESFKDV